MREGERGGERRGEIAISSCLKRVDITCTEREREREEEIGRENDIRKEIKETRTFFPLTHFNTQHLTSLSFSLSLTPLPHMSYAPYSALIRQKHTHTHQSRSGVPVVNM